MAQDCQLLKSFSCLPTIPVWVEHKDSTQLIGNTATHCKSSIVQEIMSWNEYIPLVISPNRKDFVTENIKYT
jgi:hypothetical protein